MTMGYNKAGVFLRKYNVLSGENRKKTGTTENALSFLLISTQNRHRTWLQNTENHSLSPNTNIEAVLHFSVKFVLNQQVSVVRDVKQWRISSIV